MKFMLAFGILLIASIAQSATIVRKARNTEGIIPSIVEEILKVELQSDLKKNSEVEVVEDTVAVKKVDDVVVTEEKVSAVSKDGTEQIVEFKKIETVEKPTEVVETVVPIVRNVVKEEIPQIEALRNVPVAIKEIPAIQDIIPEPIISSSNVQPEVQVESKVKTDIPTPEKVVVVETPKEEIKIVEVVIPMEVKKIVEEIPQIEKIEEKVVVVETVVPEVKKVDETVIVDDVEPATRQNNRPQIIAQIQNAVGALFNRDGTSTSAPVVEDAVQDESVAPTTAAPGGPLGTVLNTVGDRVQTFVSNVQNALNLAPASNAAADGESTTRVPLLTQLSNQVSGFQSQVQNGLTNFQNSIAQNPIVSPIVNSIQSTLGIQPSTNAAAAPASSDVPEKITTVVQDNIDVEMKPTEIVDEVREVPVVPVVPVVAAAPAIEVVPETVVVEETKKEIVPPKEIVDEKKSEVVV